MEYTQLTQQESNLDTEINTLINKEHENNNRNNEIDNIKQDIINQETEIEQQIKQLKIKQISLQSKRKQLENEQTQIQIENKQFQQQIYELILNKKQIEIKQQLKTQQKISEINEYKSNHDQKIDNTDLFSDNGIEELTFFALDLENINIEQKTEFNSNIYSPIHQTSIDITDFIDNEIQNVATNPNPPIVHVISNNQWNFEANMLFNGAEKTFFKLLITEQLRIRARDTTNTLRIYRLNRVIDEQRNKQKLDAEGFYHYSTIHKMELSTIEGVLNKHQNVLKDMDQMWQLYLNINNKKTDIAQVLLQLYNCRKKVDIHMDECDKKQANDIKLFENFARRNMFEQHIKNQTLEKKNHFEQYGRIMDELIADYERYDMSEKAYVRVHELITVLMETLIWNSDATYKMIKVYERDYGRSCEKRHYKKLKKLAKKPQKSWKVNKNQKQKQKGKKKGGKKRKKKRIYK